jgi:uncharacterized repeat protein (TIGR03803 family)
MRRIPKIILLIASVWTISLLALCLRAEITLTTLVTFDGTNGYVPQGGLVEGRDGNFYGTLSYGGWYDDGVIYRMTSNGECVILVTFDGENGSHPDCLIQGKDGNFYGTTLQGGTGGSGSVFKMKPDGGITTIASFNGNTISFSPFGLIQGQDGNLYGSMCASMGEDASGRTKSTFKVTLNGELSAPAIIPGSNSAGGLLKTKDGDFYGTTFADTGDGSSRFGYGTVFKTGHDGMRTTLVVFNGTNGANPMGELVQGSDGNIYGITTRGGAFNQGTVFRLNLTKASRPVTTNVNVPILIHPPANRINPLMSMLRGEGTATTSPSGVSRTVTNATIGSNNANLYLDEFIFLPGGFRQMAKTISATNETFRLALRYIGEIQAGHRPPELPKGVTIADVSNAVYIVSVRSMMIPPRPINFYGKVVDENDQPVAGATAHFVWDVGATNNVPRPFTDTGKISADITTDSAGLFSLTNVMGTELDVSVSKAGYYSSRTNRGTQYFKYSKPNIDSFYGIGDYFKPDPNHPVIYYLHKMGVGANALVTSQYGVRDGLWVNVPRDGTPINVDLLNRKAGNGPLEIMQKKPDFPVHGGTIESLSPSDYAKLMSATNWSFTMKISDGGFIEENEEFPFNAPESGYQAVVKYDFQKGQTNWTVNFQRNYYIKFGSPALYAQLHLETWADSDYVILMYLINPDGSRNLEPKQDYFPSSSVWRH